MPPIKPEATDKTGCSTPYPTAALISSSLTLFAIEPPARQHLCFYTLVFSAKLGATCAILRLGGCGGNVPMNTDIASWWAAWDATLATFNPVFALT